MGVESKNHWGWSKT